MSKLTSIEGLGDVTADQLIDSGIRTVESLLQEGATPNGRNKIAEVSGIHPSRILKFVNHADLMRIHGIGGEYAELLEQSGVDTVPELSTRNPENLAAKIAERNAAQRLVRRAPSTQTVADWVNQAKVVERVVNY